MTQGSGDGRDDAGDGDAVAEGATTHGTTSDGAARRHGDGEAPRPGEEDLFAALDRTRADLAAAPAPGPPEGFAARMQAALAAERAADGGPGSGSSGPARSRPPGRPDRPGPAPRRRRSLIGGRRALAGGLVALAVAAVVVGVLAVGTRPSGGPAPTAAPPTSGTGVGSPVTVSGADPVRALRSGLGAHDPGPLSDPARLDACLVAHGLPAGTVPLGSRQVVVDGTPGTLLVLPTGRAARFRVLAVGPACAPGSPSTLVDGTVGG